MYVERKKKKTTISSGCTSLPLGYNNGNEVHQIPTRRLGVCPTRTPPGLGVPGTTILAAVLLVLASIADIASTFAVLQRIQCQDFG